jgi:hypothetical protein
VGLSLAVSGGGRGRGNGSNKRGSGDFGSQGRAEKGTLAAAGESSFFFGVRVCVQYVRVFLMAAISQSPESLVNKDVKRRGTR